MLGICSRREADALIQAGRISVNDQKVTTLGYQVKATDVVKFRDKVLKPNKTFTFYLINLETVLQLLLILRTKNCIRFC